MERAKFEGRSALTEAEETLLVRSKIDMEREDKKAMAEANAAVALAEDGMRRIRELQDEWVERRVFDLLGDPKFEVSNIVLAYCQQQIH
jgi:hypothetical protein